VLLWVHLLSTGVFVGATAALPLFVVPRARRQPEPVARRSSVSRALRIYDPLAIALLGIMVMTGAWSVTGYKQNLGTDYFATFGHHLAWKLGLAFLVVMTGTYVCFGLGHRLVRQEDWGEPVDERKLSGMLSRLSASAWLTVGLTIATIAVAAGR
jgi:uncharacterized membrane protein